MLSLNDDFSLLGPNIYPRRILFEFESFIDIIKSHEESLYFWIQGGALKRAALDTLVFEHNPSDLIHRTNNIIFPVDIDLHVKDKKNYKLLVNVLTNKMGFRKRVGGDNRFMLFNEFYNFFDVRVDIVKPFDITQGLDFMCKDKETNIKDFFCQDGDLNHTKTTLFTHNITIQDPRYSSYWADVSISSMVLDSRYDFYFHEEVFEDLLHKRINFIERDYELIDSLVLKYSNMNKDDYLYEDIDLSKIIRLCFGLIEIQRLYFFKLYSFDKLERSTRFEKYIKDGFSISKTEYVANKLRLNQLKDYLSQDLHDFETFQEYGWFQTSNWNGVIDSYLGLLELTDDQIYGIININKNIIYDVNKNIKNIKRIKLRDEY